MQCAWLNAGGASGGSTRRWRNQKIADYLAVRYRSDEQLALELSSRFKSLTPLKCRVLLREPTGMTHYYNAFRPSTLKFVKRHSVEIAAAFSQLSKKSKDAYKKVYAVAARIESLGQISGAGRHISPFNGLTPTLCCLDPQRKLPIMNERTRRLLRCIEMDANAEGVVTLSKLIGPLYDIRNSFELDAYSFSEKFPKPESMPKRLASDASFSDVGLKSEIDSTAQLAAKKTVIRKLHNKLINQLSSYIKWRQKTLKQSKFDALVLGWKKGRDLLIEAKTASEGPAGRSQVRQAIGQLYDYRFTYMATKLVDLALPLPNNPTRMSRTYFTISVLRFFGSKAKH